MNAYGRGFDSGWHDGLEDGNENLWREPYEWGYGHQYDEGYADGYNASFVSGLIEAGHETTDCEVSNDEYNRELRRFESRMLLRDIRQARAAGLASAVT